MAQAISQSNSAESSVFGSYLADLFGIDLNYPSKAPNTSKVDQLLDVYQSKLYKRAAGSYDWQEFADYMVVDLNPQNQVTVYIDASDDVVEKANLVEFGTPGKPANPLMRTSEAEFNEDFQSKRNLNL